VVTVSFRDLGTQVSFDDFDPQYGYAYIWPFPEPPQVGRWAIADGIDGPTTVVVRALGMTRSAAGMVLKPLRRLIPQAEVDRAVASRAATAAASANQWLDMARQAAGLPMRAPAGRTLPTGFDPLPPTAGEADPETAGQYGGVWWRAYKLAQDYGRPADEVAAYEAIARGWYRLRDRKAHDQQMAGVTQVAGSGALPAAIRNVGSRSRKEIESMLFAGKPLWDWLEYAKDLSKQGHDDEVLELVWALIVAAEQEAQISGREPAPGYTERAAMIYRARKDYAGEIAVIQRWEQACPPARRGPGATQAKLAQRLVKAQELAAKTAQ